MKTRTCEVCGARINLLREGAKYCSTACSQKAYRQRKKDEREGPIPRVIRSRGRWVRWRYARRAHGWSKMPVSRQGFAISVTDDHQWLNYVDAVNSPVGNGLGFVLNGDGLACIDLDDVLIDGLLDQRAMDFLESLDPFYVEISPSGNGIHAWVNSGSDNGRSVYTLDNGLKVEWYADKRFICMTGNRLEEAVWMSPAVLESAA